VVVGGGGDLDLAAILQVAVERHDGAQDLVLLRDHGLQVPHVEAACLLDVAANAGGLTRREADVALAELGSEPSEVEPHLQVTQVLRREVPAGAAPFEQLRVAWVGVDLMVPIGVEEGSEQFLAVLAGKFLRGYEGEFQGAIRGAALEVVVQLQQQYWGEVDGHVHVGMLGNERRHGVVVTDAVKPDPRLPVAARTVGQARIAVERLVLVPHQRDMKARGDAE